VNNVGVSTVELLWFFLWRMTLVGLVFGAGLGAAYGMLVVPSIFLLSGVGSGPGTSAEAADGAAFSMLIGTPVGGVLGAVAGLTLGILEGVLLCVVTVFRYRDPSSETSKYQRVASLTCAVGSLVSFAVLWVAYVFPFVLPNSGPSLAELPEVLSRDLDELVIFVIGPAPVAIGAAWLSGRLIARQYVQSVSRGL
jgi:hypothetical protein